MVEEELIQTEENSLEMVPEVRLLHDRPWIPQDAGRQLRVVKKFDGGYFLIHIVRR